MVLILQYVPPVVSANLLRGFEQFSLQNNVRNAFPLTCLSGYVLTFPYRDFSKYGC